MNRGANHDRVSVAITDERVAEARAQSLILVRPV
jgi:hypothetical protein